MFIWYLTGWARFKAPGLFSHQSYRKFVTFLVKILSLKTNKQNQILPAAIEKIKFLFSK